MNDVSDGRYDGKPAILDNFQSLQNPALRVFLRLDSRTRGVLVRRPAQTDPSYPLRAWDVITRIGDTPVDDEGMVQISSNLRLHFTYLVQKLTRQGKVPLTVLRSGAEVKVDLPVSSNASLLIPPLAGDYPSYFVYGPLVFSSATIEFFNGLAHLKIGNQLPALAFLESPLFTRRGDMPAFQGENLAVVAAPFLPHKLTRGYLDPFPLVVKSINQKPVTSLRGLVEILRDSTDEFVVFEFAERGVEDLVFRRTEIMAATDEILTNNGIRAVASPDLLTVWNARPPR